MRLTARSEVPGQGVAGVAFGGYARKVVGEILQEMGEEEGRVEDNLVVLVRAVATASALVRPYKDL